jgi:putative peptide zinc metalloprotease protein
MSGAENLFSEAWHLVAPLRIGLRPNLQVRRQVFRGEVWYLFHDGLNNQFYRIRPAAYSFLVLLDGRRTVEEIWRESLTRDPENTPGQQEVVQLVAQLVEASLVQSERAGDGLRQFTQKQKRRERAVQMQIMNFLFLRLPLFDPDRLLTWLLGFGRIAISKVGAVVWIGIVLYGGKLAFENWDALLDRSQGVLAPTNLGWLYAASVLLKLWHELGHGLVCKRFGGEVRTFGVMFMVFLPLPYVDATTAYGFRERRKRVLAGAAGVLAELFAAAVALAVWAQTSQGLLNQVAYNVIFLASVSTVVFNVNPLLRFDGYYVLSDLLDMPNLAQRSIMELKWLLEKYCFGIAQLNPAERTPGAVAWTTTYGITSAIYRTLVLWAILLFVGDQLFGLGLGLAILGVAIWGVGPLYRFGRYLLTDPHLEPRRSRALMIIGGAVAVVALFLFLVPMPNRFRMPGVVKLEPTSQIVPVTDGTIAELYVSPGAVVSAGEPLMRLENPELEGKRIELQEMIEENLARKLYARDALPALLDALEKRLEAARIQLGDIERRRAGLIVRAPNAGRWAADGVDFSCGQWVPRGASLGQVVGNDRALFSVVVSQDEAARLFADTIKQVVVRIRGQGEHSMVGKTWRILPGDQHRLQTPALGWNGGGEVQVDQEDREAATTTEPFFEALVDLPSSTPVRFLQLRGGQAKFYLSPRPLAVQWWRRLRQLLKKRYQL